MSEPVINLDQVLNELERTIREQGDAERAHDLAAAVARARREEAERWRAQLIAAVVPRPQDGVSDE